VSSTCMEVGLPVGPPFDMPFCLDEPFVGTTAMGHCGNMALLWHGWLIQINGLGFNPPICLMN